MVTNLRVKLATVMLLALTLVAVSIPVMATVYQDGSDNTVKDCATANDEAESVPQDQPCIGTEEPLASNDSECTLATEPAEECGQEYQATEYTCPAVESVCDIQGIAAYQKACNDTKKATPACNVTKTCSANKTCNKTTNTTNATTCNLNKTCTNQTSANKTCTGNKTVNSICNGSKSCPAAAKECGA